MPFQSSWTDEQTETLARMWNEGRTSEEISKVLSVSRGAVMGKMKRLGLQRYKNESETQATFNEQENTQLTDLWRQGLSASAIAKAMSRSRDAILGRIRRMGLQRVKTAPAPPVAVARVRTPAVPVEDREVEPPFFPSAEPIMGLRAKHCRYPIGDPKRVGFRFCCQPVVVKLYCEEHHRLVWRAVA